MNIEKILQLRYSAYKWTVVNNDYDRLIWNDSNEIPKPTYDELVAISDDIKYQNDLTDHNAINNRQKAIVEKWPVEKQFEAITESSMGRPEKLNELLAFISGVKEDHPKSP
jgi:hypothetical protein